MTLVIVGTNGKMNLMPWRIGRLTFLKLLKLAFHFTLVIHIFYPLNLNLLFVILIQDFHMNYVLVPADKAANNVAVVWRLHYINTLKRELVDTNAYKLQPSLSERVIVDRHGCHTAVHFGVKAKENQDKDPTLYWLPKLHKKPYKARCIAYSSSCTTTELSKLLTLCLTAVKTCYQVLWKGIWEIQ